MFDEGLLSGSTLWRTVGESPLNCTLGRRLMAAVDDLTAGLDSALLVSHMAMQSSVKLRQMLSALRRTCLSDTLAPPRMELAECSVPWGPALPVISARVMASIAVASRIRYTVGEVCCRTFTRASRSSGCARWVVGASTVDSDGEGFDLRGWFGEDETVVAEVLAVRGRSRSALACAMMAPEVAGILLPPSSILRMRVLSSSSSSHTDAAGPVEPCDSVPSGWDGASRGVVSSIGVRVSSREDE
jgi:hypothetical protein